MIVIFSSFVLSCVCLQLCRENNHDCLGVMQSLYYKGSVEVQNRYVWLVYDPILIPRQLRFSLYSGAVITEGLM